jgi:K+-transporting ATPase ATPase C chain
MRDLRASLLFTAFTLLVCAAGYPLVLWLVAHGLVPANAEGRLVVRDGIVVGSSRVAQAFTNPAYLWPRPSAVSYDASATGGSNLSPANPKITERANELLARPGMVGDGPVPAELVLASGSGLDPHVTLEAALYQAPRIAAARGIESRAVTELIDGLASDPGAGLAGVRLVNVLEANLALDESFERAHGRPAPAL